MIYSEWQLHVLKTLWNIRNINALGGEDTTGIGALPGRSAKVAANRLERSCLVQRIERGPFSEPGYRLTGSGLLACSLLFENHLEKLLGPDDEPAPAGGEAK